MAVTYRASSLGGCTKAQIASRLGYEPLPHSAQTLDIFREGNLHEADVIAQLTDQGYEVFEQQKEVNLTIFGGVVVQGHIDGMIAHSDWRNVKLLEVKSMAQDSYDRVVDKGWDAGGLMEKYKWQISAYMGATSLEAMVVIKNRNRGGLHVLYTELPFYSLSDIKQRVIGMEGAVGRGELPDSCDTPNYPCSFRYLHADETPEPLDDPALVALARFYKRAQAELDNKTAQVKAARKAIRDGLGGLRKVELEGAKITVYNAKNPPSWDIKAMESDGVEVEKYRTQSVGERMRVELTDDGATRQTDGGTAVQQG